MKNLKKVLALGLALVMMLGMLTIASAAETKKVASDFPDWADVENKDAVSLMVDLGVINGTEAGTYAPKNNIDRASWAKMVFFVLTGENDAKIYASDYPVLKDIAGTWAQGYIEYLYSTNCISGDNLGNYNPTEPISVVAAAKTMLTGLGYNSKIEGYESDSNWAANIMNKAKSIGLLKGISLKQGENITRDAAALMVYNALSAKTQTAKYTLNFMTGERVPSGEYTEGVTLGEKAFNIVKTTAVIDKVEKGVAHFASWTLKDEDDKAIAVNNTDGVKATLGDVGKTVTLWVSPDGKTIASSSVASAATTPFKVVTGGVTWANAYNSKHDDYVADEATGVKYIVDGGTASTTRPGDGTKAGEVVEFYTNDDGKVDLVHVYQWKVATLSADPASKTKGDETTVDLKFGGYNKVPVDQISGDWASLVKGDVVLYYAQGAGNSAQITLEKAEKITGKVTRVSKDNAIRVNGTDYSESGIVTAESVLGNKWDDFSNEYDFYLDKNGTIAALVKITDEVTSDLAIVLQTGYVGAQGGIGGASGYAQAELLFTDGSTQIVTVEKVGSDKELDADKMTALMGGKKAVFVEASENDGKWTLTAIEETKITSVAAEKVVKAQINFVDGDTTISANNKTVFIVAKGNKDDGYVYSVHTGYKNVPGLTTSVESYVYTKESGAAADYVYLVATSFTGDAPEGYVYFKDAAADYTNSDGNNVYSVIDADGSEIELVVKADGVQKGFVKIKAVDDAGVVTALDTYATVTDNVTASGNGVFTAGSSVGFDSSTVCVVIDIVGGKFDSVANFDPENLDFSTGDEGNYTSVQALVVGEGTADYIYVVRTAAAD